MTLSKEELDLLRLIALCKDIPVNCGELFRAEMFSADFIEALSPYIVKSKCKLSYRLNERGYALLKRLNVPHHRDSAAVGKGRTMNKRLANAKVVLSLYSRRVSMFSDEFPMFIPAFVFRQSNPKGNVLGASQFVGLLAENDITYIVFYIDATTKLKPYMEISAAERFMLINNANPQYGIMFMNEDSKVVNLWVSENKTECGIFRDLKKDCYFSKIGDDDANT